jgi:hypothetical protein
LLPPIFRVLFFFFDVQFREQPHNY